MLWTMAMVLRVKAMRMPPPISCAMLPAFAEMTAPTNAITGGIAAMYLRSTTSDRRPTMGESTDCMSSGPWMIQPLMLASPRSRMIKAMTEPAATTTKTCAIMAKQLTKT